jgi:hypothetical protein
VRTAERLHNLSIKAKKPPTFAPTDSDFPVRGFKVSALLRARAVRVGSDNVKLCHVNYCLPLPHWECGLGGVFTQLRIELHCASLLTQKSRF